MASLRSAIQSFDLENYLTGHGSDQVNRDERVTTCPHCGKPKLVVNLAKRVWHCWHCQSLRPDGRGGLLSLIQLLDGVDRDQARSQVIAGFYGSVRLEDMEDMKGLLLEGDLFSEYEGEIEIKPPASWRWVDHTGILPYCQKRGITPWDSEQFKLMWCQSGRYRGRLVFPVWEGPMLVYWQARAMWEKSEHPAEWGKYIKSLNPPNTTGAAGASDVLFNLNVAKKHPSVVITEGPIDAIHVGPEAVCTFGKRLSGAQIAKLRRAGVTSIELMWDGPSATEPYGAWPEMFSAAEQLKWLFDTRLVFLPQGDPGDYTRDQLNWFRQQSSRPVPAGHTLRLEEI